MPDPVVHPEDRHYPSDEKIEGMLSGMPISSEDVWHVKAFLRETLGRSEAAAEHLVNLWKGREFLEQFVQLSSWQKPCFEAWKATLTNDAVNDICLASGSTIRSVIREKTRGQYTEPIERPKVRLTAPKEDTSIEIVSAISAEIDGKSVQAPSITNNNHIYDFGHRILRIGYPPDLPPIYFISISWKFVVGTWVSNPEILTPFVNDLAVSRESASSVLVSDSRDSKFTLHPKNGLDLLDTL